MDHEYTSPTEMEGERRWDNIYNNTNNYGLRIHELEGELVLW